MNYSRKSQEIRLDYMIIKEAMFLSVNNGNEIPHADLADEADFLNYITGYRKILELKFRLKPFDLINNKSGLKPASIE